MAASETRFQASCRTGAAAQGSQAFPGGSQCAPAWIGSSRQSEGECLYHRDGRAGGRRGADSSEHDIAAGHYRGPLHGVPYAAKDLVATKGIRTTNGSKATANWIPDHESTATARLNRGRRNPDRQAQSPGVRDGQRTARAGWTRPQSVGSQLFAIGIFKRFGRGARRRTWFLLAVGSDSGGSIRDPAKSCGIVGLKPTYGRVSRFGVTTLSWTLDHVGPMARTVADVARMLQVIAGADPRDRASAAAPVPDYTKALTGNIKGLRIGVPTEHFFDARPCRDGSRPPAGSLDTAGPGSRVGGCQSAQRRLCAALCPRPFLIRRPPYSTRKG